MDERDREAEADDRADREAGIASFAVNHAEWSSTVIRSGPVDLCGSPSALEDRPECGSVVSLTGNGHVQPVSIQIQR